VLHTCGNCQSVFFEPREITDFVDLAGPAADFWRYYLEGGGGVWETIWPVLAAAGSGQHSLLDVGCGMGFLVDFWRRTGRGEALGVETAEYGALGSALFDMPVLQQRLEDCANLQGRTFDVVHASEVIEHVPHPARFVSLLRAYLAPGGLLVLTTPSAEFIHSGNDGPDLAAALSPGFHAHLYSRRALEDVLRRAGFVHVVVRQYSQRLIAWASGRPLDIDDQDSSLRGAYFAYLERTLASPGTDARVWTSYAYRYVRDKVNFGDFRAADPVAGELMRRLATAWGESILDMASLAGRSASCPRQWAALAIEGPFFMPVLLYALGVLALLHHRQFDRAVACFDACEQAALCFRETHRIVFLEAAHIIWPARAMRANANLARGHIDAAASFWKGLAAAGRSPGVDDVGLLSGTYVQEELQRGYRALLAVNAHAAARQLVDMPATPVSPAYRFY
jgi:SAM-dependent methyltransferase